MFKYIRSFKEATFATKNFWLNAVVYALLMLFSTIYVYGRLHYIHSSMDHTSHQEK